MRYIDPEVRERAKAKFHATWDGHAPQELSHSDAGDWALVIIQCVAAVGVLMFIAIMF